MNCKRCNSKLPTGQYTSYFKDESICQNCVEDENYIIGKLEDNGIDYTIYEGCGYLPLHYNKLKITKKGNVKEK